MRTEQQIIEAIERLQKHADMQKRFSSKWYKAQIQIDALMWVKNEKFGECFLESWYLQQAQQSQGRYGCMRPECTKIHIVQHGNYPVCRNCMYAIGGAE